MAPLPQATFWVLTKLSFDMIKLFFERVLFRTYWFYEKVIKEDDNFMKFYYAVFAFSMFMVFYTVGLALFIWQETNANIFEFKKNKYFLFAVAIVLVNMAWFYKRKEPVLKKIKKANKNLNNYDLFVILYVFFAFFCFFYSIYQL